MNNIQKVKRVLNGKIYTLVGYGVNVGHIKNYVRLEYERFSTFETLVDAMKCFKVLTGNVETNFWDRVQVEQIWEREDGGDYEYDVIKEDQPNNVMLDNLYWDKIKLLNQQIYDFTVDADRENDKVLNICWLKLGYISPDSGDGFFHYSSINEFKRLLGKVRHISNPDIKKEDIKQYLAWLESNECLFDKGKSQIEQISNMLYGYGKNK